MDPVIKTSKKRLWQKAATVHFFDATLKPKKKTLFSIKNFIFVISLKTSRNSQFEWVSLCNSIKLFLKSIKFMPALQRISILFNVPSLSLCNKSLLIQILVLWNLLNALMHSKANSLMPKINIFSERGFEKN